MARETDVKIFEVEEGHTLKLQAPEGDTELSPGVYRFRTIIWGDGGSDILISDDELNFFLQRTFALRHITG